MGSYHTRLFSVGLMCIKSKILAIANSNFQASVRTCQSMELLKHLFVRQIERGTLSDSSWQREVRWASQRKLHVLILALIGGNECSVRKYSPDLQNIVDSRSVCIGNLAVSTSGNPPISCPHGQ